MRKLSFSLIVILLIMTTLTISCNKTKTSFESSWHEQPDRIWIGPEFWANRLQDWRIDDGYLKCNNNTHELRTVHLLTQQITNQVGNAHLELKFGLNSACKSGGEDNWAGLLIGAGENDLNYKGSSLIQHSPGEKGGILIVLNENSELIFLDNAKDRELIGGIPGKGDISTSDSIILKVNIFHNNDSLYTVSASAINAEDNQVISSNSLTRISGKRIEGNIAITATHIDNFEGTNYWFEYFKCHGEKLVSNPTQRFGPVMGVLHLHYDKAINLNIQMAPIGEEDQTFIRFYFREKGNIKWEETDSIPINRETFIASTKLDSLPDTNIEYRIGYKLKDYKGRNKIYFYSGELKPEPTDKDEIKAAIFSGITHAEGSINGSKFNYPERLWFPHNDFTTSAAAQKADILFFTGNQVSPNSPTTIDLSSIENTRLDYLYKWYIFLWSAGDLTRNTPTVCLMDDGDYFQDKLWGESGLAALKLPKDTIYPEHYTANTRKYWTQDQGGYLLPGKSINFFQKLQTSHLPKNNFDTSSIEQSIGVYFTSLKFARIDFSILEDRKFKSSPADMVPDAKVVNGFQTNRYIWGSKLDNEDAKLLGDKQMAFLENWIKDWEGADMKACIHQSIFASLSTLPTGNYDDNCLLDLAVPAPGNIPENHYSARDFNSNGWPQTARKEVLSVLRKGFVSTISGDQNLGAVVQMGVDRWDDAVFSFSVPSVGNPLPRRWFPKESGRDHQEGQPLYTGKYFDGFSNRITVKAVANPAETGKNPGALYNRAVGYGIVTFNKPKATIRFECWKRDADPANREEGIYNGWPQTISILDNYQRSVRSWLPKYEVSGLKNKPVFEIIEEETGETVYKMRTPDNIYQPGVFTYGGEYTIRIGDPDVDTVQVFEHVKARYNKSENIIEVEF